MRKPSIAEGRCGRNANRQSPLARSRRCWRCRRYRRCQCYSWTVLKKRVVHFMVTETIRCADIPTPVSRIGLGTWAIGGSLWGGSDETESIAAIQGAVDQGINLIHNPPAYRLW